MLNEMISLFPYGYHPLQERDVRDALARARLHVDAVNGFPYTPEPGECEVCDILWLIDSGEGDHYENLFNLRDAMRERKASS